MRKITDQIKPVLAFTVVILGFAYFFLCTFTGVHANDQILIAIVGSMTMALGYYFGNSSGSAKKDEVIQEQIKIKEDAST